jgi:hypothetical protein
MHSEEVMKVCSVEPDVDANTLLPGAQFIDAYSVTVTAALDARHAAEKMTARGPRWIEALLGLRNRLVAPFGLKTAVPTGNSAPDRVGIFPVISERPDRLVAGLDDAHLNFRLVVDVTGSGTERRVTATTLVLTHNLLGRAYLAVILPFHRLIVPSMLRKVAR